MKKENIKQIICQLFMQNYNAYGNTQDTEVVAIAQEYWDNRLETEIERDNAAGVTCEDYINWCIAERDMCVDLIG
jgi:hypothetical protein